MVVTIDDNRNWSWNQKAHESILATKSLSLTYIIISLASLERPSADVVVVGTLLLRYIFKM